MQLRTKAVLFFGVFLITLVTVVALYVQYVVGNMFQKQTTDSFRIIAEQSESSYLSFLGSIKVRVLDWTSDNTIRELSKSIISAKEGSAARAQLAEQFATYIREKKMPYDKTILITDLLDKNGIVIASTHPERIGKDEGAEEVGDHKAHNFTDAINSQFGEVFFGRIIYKEEESMEPTMNATVRLFDLKNSTDPKPLDAVLLVYFQNSEQIAEALGSGTSIYAGIAEQQGRLTSKALLETYQTSNIYLVNDKRTIITHSRSMGLYDPHQNIQTLPVTECLENGKEISGEYDGYQGVRVLGSSMCFKDDGVVIIVEVDKDEVFAPLKELNRSTIIGAIIVVMLGTFLIVLLLRRPLARINDVVLIAKRIAKGDLDARVAVHSQDELGYLATSFNTMITAVRDAEKELRMSKHRVEEEKVKDEALLASLGEGMIATDRNGNVIAINRMAEKMLGWNAADAIGKKATEVVKILDEDGNESSVEDTASLKQTAESATSKTLFYRKKDDGHFPVAVTITPVILEGKTVGSINIFRDITKEKELEKMRLDLLSLASHQLRTPLSGTKWLIETLRKGIHGVLNTKQTEYLNEIYKINERMTQLVFDMLNALRIESGIITPNKKEILVSSVFKNASEFLTSAAIPKNISLRFAEDTSTLITTDPTLLLNILESFISNAITYSHPDSEVIVDVKKSNDEVVLSIKDTGIGIPESEQEQIFSRFYRATNAKTYNTRGSGLGLYIASILAEKIGARLSFESKEHEGSTFFIHLPAKA